MDVSNERVPEEKGTTSAGRKRGSGRLVDRLVGGDDDDFDQGGVMVGGEEGLQDLTADERRLIEEAIARGGSKGSWLRNMMRVWGRRRRR